MRTVQLPLFRRKVHILPDLLRNTGWIESKIKFKLHLASAAQDTGLRMPLASMSSAANPTRPQTPASPKNLNPKTPTREAL